MPTGLATPSQSFFNRMYDPMHIPLEDSNITLWIDQLRASNESAAAKLWQHVMVKLQHVARNRLNPRSRRIYDEEDAAQSAFHSVCAGIMAGKYPDLQDRGSLWGLLLRVTAMKVEQRHRFDHRKCRDVRRSVSSFDDKVGDAGRLTLDALLSREPSAGFISEFSEVCEMLFSRLDEPALRDVAQLRMEGFNDTEIAEQLRCSRRTVQRRVEAIKRHWESLEKSLE